MTSYPSLIPELLSIRPYLHYQLELIFITVRLFRQTYRNLSELVDDSTSLPPCQVDGRGVGGEAAIERVPNRRWTGRGLFCRIKDAEV